MPLNSRLARLAENPFARLAALLAAVPPRANEPPILRRSDGGAQVPLPLQLAGAALWQDAAIRALPGAYIARGKGSDNPGRRYIRLALVHDDATVASGMDRLTQVL